MTHDEALDLDTLQGVEVVGKLSGKSNDQAQSSGGLQEILGNINSGVGAFGIGIGVQNEMFDYAVRNNYKSANSWGEFKALRETQKSWRMTNTLGKTGTKLLNATKTLGSVGAVGSTAITLTRAGMYYYDGGTNPDVAIKAGLDAIMTGVGFLGPIGFGISASYFILDAATDGFGGYGKIK